ncbi:LysM peptidoglycan-binding domain-containing protein [Rhizosphaericola mali]|uniref:LysM peptidoglycan-binding domain-containing protein n=1 Tax=Rhizosphaericola mali TaxID=2545455 RepID=A0A5P2FW20_9BACT|nr:LysM peptidoglycan-binding domain-containing protein [Rhizosphaericola mali]QES87714.1 LysM peptidoglycan-binding domain-containing protein [Rhizosphaericola mali]
MKKRFLALSFAVSLMSVLFAQEAPVKHKILAGETLSKLATKYETTVGDIMRFNGMNTNSKLVVGQEIKIPPAGVHIVASESNAVETSSAEKVANTAASDPNAGKTHTVIAGESLYKISKESKVSVDNLKKYNNLADNNIKVGQVLQLSAEPATVTDATTPTVSDNAQTTTETTTPVKASSPVKEPAATSSTTDNNQKVLSTETTQLAGNNGGAFGEMFGKDTEGRSLEQAQGLSKIFKSKSGWSDQKYYIMMNNVGPGSIVKVTYNGNSIFAKVLWNLIDTKENSGLKFRLSDAAAQALNITSDSFDLSVDYFE